MTNGEKYKTAQERAEAFQLHCKSLEGKCRADMSCDECRFSWLDLEAEEKPLPCPFCGGECKTIGNKQCWWITCDKCKYTSSNFKSEIEAIAAHNRVAKKCREGK